MKKIKSNMLSISEQLLTAIRCYESQYIHFIKMQLGITIHSYQIIDLYKTIAEACHKFDCDPQEYLNLLIQAQPNSPILEHLIAGITIGETYFFRDKVQMDLLQSTLLPELIENKRKNKNFSLHIWSAGCASGEEIYSIAIILNELLPDIQLWKLHLFATDINTQLIKKAIAGKYSEWSMRSISPEHLKKYFIAGKNEYILLERIKKLVNFAYLNLQENSYPSILNGTCMQDLILCRNVLIYFNKEHVQSTTEKFYDCLAPGGCLMLGASDPVNIGQSNFKTNFDKGILLIRPTLSYSLPLNKNKLDIVEKIKPINIKVPEKTQSLEKMINQLLAESRWQEVLDITQKSDASADQASFLLNAKATALASTGQLEKSILACQEGIQFDPINVYCHFTLALVLIELDKLTEAEAELRKTIFLNNQFVEGHFQLGLLLLRKKQYQPGIKSLKNALEIVKTKDPTQPMVGFKGLEYGRLADILNREIELYAVNDEAFYASGR